MEILATIRELQSAYIDDSTILGIVIGLLDAEQAELDHHTTEDERRSELLKRFELADVPC